MRISKVIVAPFLALALLGTAACGEPAPALPACTEYQDEVLDLDDEGECESVDDEAEEESEDSDKKKKKRSSGGKKRR